MTTNQRHIESQHPLILPPFMIASAEMTPGTDVELGTRISASKAERDSLLIDSLPLVHIVARTIHSRLPQHVELEELISAGTLGLIDAMEKFDPNRFIRFKTYATFRIRGAILDFLRSSDWAPRELRRKERALKKAVHNVTGRCGSGATASEIAAEMSVELSVYQQLLGEIRGAELDSLSVENEWGETALASLAGPETNDPLFQCLRDEKRACVIEAVEKLPEKERLVLTFYYLEDQSMKEVGIILGLDESRVSQLHTSAVKRLRRSLGLAGNVFSLGMTHPSATTHRDNYVSAI